MDAWLPALAWVLLLALLPWWLGLPLLLALVASMLILSQRLLLSGYAVPVRRALRWGLPGLLLALLRALGGDGFAWVVALLGALAGYTLLAGLEAWLDRELRRAPADATSVVTTSAEWPELALASVGPVATIIELVLPCWLPVAAQVDDPRGGMLSCHAGICRFASGEQIDSVGASVAFSPDSHWFVAQVIHPEGVVLWDRSCDRRHRLRGWRLAGWYQGRPWLSRGESDMPLSLSAVLGRDDES